MLMSGGLSPFLAVLLCASTLAGAAEPKEPNTQVDHPASSGIPGIPTVHIGTVEVPAGCALARREHPRLLFTKAGVSAIRVRIAQPGLREIYGRLKQTVDAQNYDIYDTWWQKVGTAEYQEDIGLGWWRVEVEPPRPQAEDVFLHVLWATDGQVAKMFPVETIEKEGQAGARFTADGMEVEVLFATTGGLSARLKLAANGKPFCDRSLAKGVEDDYRKWSRDGRFSAWLTNAPMRAVVGKLDPISGN